MEQQKDLPLGVASFNEIVSENCIYVDKTDLIAKIAKLKCPAFISRPRRFGKSTLVSTFHELFAHGLENFSGLKIERNGLYTDDKTYKVLRFDFSNYDDRFDIDWYLQDKFKRQLDLNCIEFNDNAKSIGALLDDVLLKQAPLSLVLLIDEYDAPLTQVLDNQQEFYLRRNVLQSFYASIKCYNDKFRFIFITGVTRYAQTSIFSAFNNMVDLTFKKEYGALLGYTQEDLEFYFKDYIESAACVLNQENDNDEYNYETVLQLLKQNYDGYCFDSKASTFVYNPWSILNFLNYPEDGFGSYWLESGGAFPSLLVKYLDNVKGLFVKNKSDQLLNVDSMILTSKSDLIQPLVDISSKSFSFKAVLYQSGYLSIKSVKRKDYFYLGFPNLEVKQAYADALLAYLGQKVSSEFVQEIQEEFAENLLQQRYDEVTLVINQLLNVLSYESVAKFNESLFRYLFKLTVLFAGATNVQSEAPNAVGRCDLMFTFQDTCFVCEFKLATSLSEVNTKLAEAEQQISTRGYTNVFGTQEVVALVIVAVNQSKDSSDSVVRRIEVIKKVFPK